MNRIKNNYLDHVSLRETAFQQYVTNKIIGLIDKLNDSNACDTDGYPYAKVVREIPHDLIVDITKVLSVHKEGEFRLYFYSLDCITRIESYFTYNTIYHSTVFSSAYAVDDFPNSNIINLYLNEAIVEDRNAKINTLINN
jgi:hypothetical protein